VPLVLFFVLFTHREAILTRRTRHGDESVRSFSFLFFLYTPQYYYVSIVDLLRRLALSSMLLAFEKSDQLLMALAISIISLVSFREVGPCK
jgi:hypothetical protein